MSSVFLSIFSLFRECFYGNDYAKKVYILPLRVERLNTFIFITLMATAPAFVACTYLSCFLLLVRLRYLNLIFSFLVCGFSPLAQPLSHFLRIENQKRELRIKRINAARKIFKFIVRRIRILRTWFSSKRKIFIIFLAFFELRKVSSSLFSF